MNIHYKKLTENELDKFIEMRILQLREEGAKEDIDLVPALKDYYNRHMANGTFVSWLALENDKIIGTSGMSFVEKPPYFGCPNGRVGLLSSMYTEPGYRRKGIAKESYKSGQRSKGLRLRNSADYGIGYGKALVHGFWVCETREFFAL